MKTITQLDIIDKMLDIIDYINIEQLDIDYIAIYCNENKIDYQTYKDVLTTYAKKLNTLTHKNNPYNPKEEKENYQMYNMILTDGIPHIKWYKKIDVKYKKIFKIK